MTFDNWYEKNMFELESKDSAKEAWNAAIDAATSAIEGADHNDDDSGLGANCNAMVAVEKLKSL